MYDFYRQTFTTNPKNHGISKLVGTGDPKEPCQETESTNPLVFWRVQSLILRETHYFLSLKTQTLGFSDELPKNNPPLATDSECFNGFQDLKAQVEFILGNLQAEVMINQTDPQARASS